MMRVKFLILGLCFLGIINAQEKKYNDFFCRIIKNCKVDDLDVARYNKDSVLYLNTYDIEYVDCQFFLYMLEYAYRYNDQMAFLYLSNYLQDFYKRYDLIPGNLALDMIQKFRNEYRLEDEVSKDNIEAELKHKFHKLKREEKHNLDFYPVICDVFSTDHFDHYKTSLLFESLCYNIKKISGPGDKEAQLFFLSFILADQTLNPLAYKYMIESISFFYVGSALKMNDNIFDFVKLWTNLIPDMILGSSKSEFIDSLREYIYKDRSICK
jgi:hypothetical protein